MRWTRTGRLAPAVEWLIEEERGWIALAQQEAEDGKEGKEGKEGKADEGREEEKSTSRRDIRRTSYTRLLLTQISSAAAAESAFPGAAGVPDPTAGEHLTNPINTYHTDSPSVETAHTAPSRRKSMIAGIFSR